jgi:hypothetical protein
MCIRTLLHDRNTLEISEYMNSHRGTHVLYFSLGDVARGCGFLSYADAQTAVRLGFEATRDRLAAELDYLEMIFRPRGVVLNADIGRISFEEAVAHGQEHKRAQKERAGAAPVAKAG